MSRLSDPVVRLEGWSCVRSDAGNPYLAPEQRTLHLTGAAHGHPRHADGHRVRTSAVTAARGRLVWTSSGTCYELGEAAPEYRAWVQENAPPWDDANPVQAAGAPPRADGDLA